MRKQHYRFAHQILPAAVLPNPDAWWAAAPANGLAMIRDAWAAAGQGLGPEDLADGSSLQIAPMSLAPGVEALVITLPPPEAATECYWAALVRGPGRPPRYFVAERGLPSDDGSPRTYWAEWRHGPGGAVMRIRGRDLPRTSPEALIEAAAAEVMSQPPGALPFPSAPASAAPARPQPAPGKKSRLGLYLGCGCLSVVGLVVLTG